jgi:4-amino-4-deoxy-L-arabinose transferase-like glycosyltransferase
MKRKYRVPAAVIFLLLIMVVQVALSTRQQSPSWDEGNHIYAGYMNWMRGEYFLNPEHPPLVKLVATLPLVPLDLKVAPRRGRSFKSESWFGGRELLFRNSPKDGGKYTADTLLFRVHMAAMIFGLILAGLLFAAGKEMFGAGAGLVALALFAFDPSVLAHAPFVTTDTGAACGWFAAVYAFYRFAKSMSWKRALVCGVAMGLALVAKHSAVALAPLFALLAAAEIGFRWRTQGKRPGRDAVRLLAGMGMAVAVALVVLWGVYGFRWSMTPAGVNIPSLTQRASQLSPAMRNFILFSDHFHLLPRSYLFGLADVQAVGDIWPTYILGRIYRHGQWFFFPAVLASKWTVGTLALIALSIYACCSGKLRLSREVLFLAIPAVFYMAVAMTSPLNMGIRHVLPVVPFAFLLVGAAASWLIQRRRTWIYAVGLFLALHVVSSARAFPNYLPYSNILWGGTSKTYMNFSDCQVDWAQQLKWTKQWVDRHNVKECWFAYFASPFLLPADYGIPCKPLPTYDDPSVAAPPVVHGPVLISYGDLSGYEFTTKVRNPYQKLAERQPDDAIADAIAVYYGDIAIPEAAVLPIVRRANSRLRANPKAALEAARAAVELAPNGFDANRALGEALAATGDPAGARAAFLVAMSRTAEMEPDSLAYWRQTLEARLKALSGGQGAGATR